MVESGGSVGWLVGLVWPSPAYGLCCQINTFHLLRYTKLGSRLCEFVSINY